MKVRILGCSGGIGGAERRTTALLADQDILIDAGTGVGDLPLEALAAIDHVFLTHAHLDHVAALPLLLDAVADSRQRPVTVYGLSETLVALQTHLFNWTIWPDFAVLPTVQAPLLRWQPLLEGEVVELGGRRLRALPARHTVPALGYCLESVGGSLVFTGDTGPNPELWPLLNAMPELRYLLIETAFGDAQRALAERSGHLCPALLRAELAQYRGQAEVFLSHLKPGRNYASLLSESRLRIVVNGTCATATGENTLPALRLLQNNQVFEF